MARSSSSAFVCPRCGSPRIRRSLPQDAWERLLRAFSPIHYYRCRECNHRASHWGELPLLERDQPPDVQSRPVEQRDLTAAAIKRRRSAFLFALAIAAGVVMGITAERCSPPPPAAASSP